MNVFLRFAIMIVCFCSCNHKNNTSPNSFNTTEPVKNMSGTWVLYKYQTQNGTSPISKSDTLIFSPNNTYTYNGLSTDYYLSNSNLYYSYRLSLYNTAFGYITGIIPYNFESTNEINGVEFSNPQVSSSNNGKYILWLHRI